MIESVFFFVFSSIAIFSALNVILHPKPTRALLSLIVTMFSLAVLYVLLSAPFIAMVHLIIYAGAVLVLFLFVIMLQGVGAEEVPLHERFNLLYIFSAILVGSVFLIGILSVLNRAESGILHRMPGGAEEIGRLLFSKYLLPFELASIILLLGVFAAVALAKKGPEA